MLKDPFLRHVTASLGAWLLVLFCVPSIWTLGTMDVRITIGFPLIIGMLLSAVFAPWWLLDAILLRPTLLPRLGWIGVAPIECLSLCAYRGLLQRHEIANGGGVPMILHLSIDMLILYACYLVLSVLTLNLLSRLADRKTSPPDN